MAAEVRVKNTRPLDILLHPPGPIRIGPVVLESGETKSVPKETLKNPSVQVMLAAGWLREV